MTLMLTTDCNTESHGAEAAIDASSDSGAERRRGLRIAQHRLVKIFEPVGGRYFGGETQDVSATGLRIELPASVTIRSGENINIHVGLNHFGQSLPNRKQMMPAKIVWVKRGNLQQPRIEVGVEFLSNIAAHLDAA